MRIELAALALLLIPSLSLAEVEDKRTIRETLNFTGGGNRTVVVDIVSGDIKVTAHGGTDVRAVITESIRADSNEDLNLARNEVRLDRTSKDGAITFYEEGPYRCNCSDGDRGSRRSNRRRYHVRYDVEIQAPEDVNIDLHTVNGGIEAAGIKGDYEARTINGGVTLSDVAGSQGNVYALNGGVKVTFSKNPTKNSSYGSLNGKVRLFFQPGLSADFLMKTFNGKIYSDFEMTSLPSQPIRMERDGTKRIFRSDRSANGRVGSGGIEIELKGFNGNMYVLERGRSSEE